MSSLKLPTSGDRNWGGALNAYIESLSNRISVLEDRFTKVNEGMTTIANIGYASTGLVGSNNKIVFDKDTSTIQFSGEVYIGGGVNSYFLVEEPVEKVVTETTSVSYYVILKYDQAIKEFLIELRKGKLDLDYSEILIGFYYDNNNNPHFVQYYYSSLKTIAQHQYELFNPWVDMRDSAIKLSIYAETGIINDISIDNPYDIYCGGLNTNSITVSSMPTDGHLRVDYASNIILLQDSETRSVKVAENTINKEENNNGNYYRILLDLFGNIIVQKAYDSTPLQLDNTYWSEQQLYNTRFILELSDYYPNLYVEVARFGYNYNELEANESSGIFVYDQLNNSNGQGSFKFVQSLNKGVISQNANNVFMSKSGEIRLGSSTETGVVFKNTRTSAANFKLNYIDNNGESSIININKNYSLEDSPTLLWTKSDTLDKDIDLRGANFSIASDNISIGSYDTNYPVLKYNNEGTSLFIYSSDKLKPYKIYNSESTLFIGDLTGNNFIDLDLYSDYKYINLNDFDKILSTNIEMQSGREITFLSDRRCKYDINKLNTNYLQTVLNTPIVSYKYNNSSKKQVGIIAQDLEDNLENDKNIFVIKQDTEELKEKRTIAETKLVYILWKALQEEHNIVKELEEKVKALESRNTL